MKKLWLVAILVLAIGSTCMAAQGISIGGGVTKGALVYTYSHGDYEYGTDLGFYASATGSFKIGSIPIALTGSYARFSTETLTAYSETAEVEYESMELEIYNSSSLLKVFAGYTLPNMDVSLGGGWVSQNGYWSYDYPASTSWENIRVSGLALAAFGTFPVTDKLKLGAQLFYLPKTKSIYTNDDGALDNEDPANGWGYEISGIYQVLPQLAVEAGYQSFTSRLQYSEVGSNPSMSTSAIFAGVKFSF